MKLNSRIRIIAVTVLIIPLIAILITSSVIFVNWTLSWEESEGLSVPRFLHTPLLSVLKGKEEASSRFAGIILVLDDKGKTIYIAPQAKKEIDKFNWNSMEEAYAELMAKMPQIPINIAVYTYKDRAGLVLYVEEFFAGQKFFRVHSAVIIAMYFGLICLPVIIFSVNSRPILRSLVNLESAAYEIGRGNLDSSVVVERSAGRKRYGIKEVESLVNAFERMRLELKENHETQNRIMMAISHDLKTPLTLIKGYIEAMRDGMARTPEEITKYADVIYDRSMLLEERINDLIYFAKLRTSDWQSRFEKFSINELLDEADDIFRNDAFIRRRQFTFINGLTDGMMIAGDRKLLFQVFENLFDNACRYTEEHDKIEIKANSSGNYVMIRFEDSGSGIEEKHREHIFNSFYRADSGRNTRGIGIGLTSAKTIIENHGGSIKYEPSALGGAGFIIQLPLLT
ncbi:MAG: HAMP domain-containing sensor histidine kinase [Spirochaetales bacterium]|uniref:histidine kinase n=1 Tax=Candidatus Thalassospirochaeta sargassi TaxID=3119039 RepID=A0AAJ1ICN7_9SPIO|nr:HAMP domain-containing sensor histidine kinase [Spirochaetales bacterium]